MRYKVHAVKIRNNQAEIAKFINISLMKMVHEVF